MTSPLTLSPEAQDLLFREARTANAFTQEPVTDEQVAAIYDLVQYAPTAMNTQPLRVLLVRDGEPRERLLKHMADGNRDKTANAPVVAILAADTDFPLSRVTPPTGEPLLGPAGHAGWRQIRRKLPSSMSKSPATVRRTCEKQLPRQPLGVIEMPRFMGFVRMEENVGTPPQALFDAMDAHIGERAAKGVFLDGGGLYGTEDAVNFVVRQGEVSRVDGPYAEAKEVVGGWAILQYDTLEEAVADQQEFAELHAKHWPEVTVISTLRQISNGPDAPGD